MRKKLSSILAVMLSAAIGITGICASAAASEEYEAFLEASVKIMSNEAENKEVYFYYDTMEESDSFKLYENGIEVGTFVDDGKYSVSGDDMMGDGVYTLKYSIDTDTIPEGSKHFDNVYHVRNGNTIVSDDETISVYKPFTQQELDNMAKVDEEVKKLIESDEYTASSLEERKVLVTELLNSLAEQGLVKSNFTFSNTLAGFEYSCGVQGAIMLKGWDEYEEPIDSPGVTTEPVETTTTTIPKIEPITLMTTTTVPLSGYCFYTENKKIIADDVSVVVGDTVPVPFEFDNFIRKSVDLKVSGSEGLEIIGVYLEDGTEAEKNSSGDYVVTEAKGYVKIKAVTEGDYTLYLKGEARSEYSSDNNIIYIDNYSKNINVNASETAVTTAVTETEPTETTGTSIQIPHPYIIHNDIVIDNISAKPGETVDILFELKEFPDTSLSGFESFYVELYFKASENIEVLGLVSENKSEFEETDFMGHCKTEAGKGYIRIKINENTESGSYEFGISGSSEVVYNTDSEIYVYDEKTIAVNVSEEEKITTTEITTAETETIITTVTTTTTTTTATTQPVGDANGDNEVNVRDCADIASALAKGDISKLPKSADFNGDGKIDVRDAAAIAKMLAEKMKK